MDKFYIVDGNNLLFRAFYALPVNMMNANGEYCNAVFGFVRMMIEIIRDHKPKYIAVAFDSDKKNFRHNIFPEYKGTRKPAPMEMANQFALARKFLDAMGVRYVEEQGIEADDIIGVLSKKFDNVERVIVTADRDCFQLISDNCTVLSPKKGISGTVQIDANTLLEEYGLTPSQIIDYKALAGDTSDNIPGVSGIGEKTAKELLATYGTLDNLYAHINEITGRKHDNLVNDKERAYMSYKLATILRDYDLNYSLEDFGYKFPFDEKLRQLFMAYQFKSLISKDEFFDKTPIKIVEEGESENVTSIDELKDIINNVQDKFVFYIDTDKLYFMVNGVDYVINFNNDLLSVGIMPADAMFALKPILEDEKIDKITSYAKDMMHILDKYNISLNNLRFDCSIARYLLTSGKGAKIPSNVIELMAESGYGQKRLAKSIYEYSVEKQEKLNELNMCTLFYDIELPLTKVLFNMEKNGFKLDKNRLTELDKKYDELVDLHANKIYELAGAKFNLNSPKQLADVLFNKLQLVLPKGKKQSTDIAVLNLLQGQHPIVDEIIEYRKTQKLSTTYFKPLLSLMDSENKIHTIFNQTITSTGRLSSSEPNLQNIPVRSEEGKLVRLSFVPSSEDGYLISADYSQIELRLLANFSGDEQLIDAYNANEDIHARTASEIYGVPPCDVTDEMRRSAKLINFGIIYGISDYGLSQNIGTTKKQAKDFIDMYFARYPKVEKYMQDNVNFCREHGYVTTYFGRIRYIPEIVSSNYVLRSFGERAAMNSPLQGTASDIIKVAMVNVFNKMQEAKLRSKLIMQVHDELIIDAVGDEIEQCKKILKDCMENVVELKVKMKVNIAMGKNWSDAK